MLDGLETSYFGANIDSPTPGFRNISPNYRLNLPGNEIKENPYRSNSHPMGGGCGC